MRGHSGPSYTLGQSEQRIHFQVLGDLVWSLGAMEREPETRSQEPWHPSQLAHGFGVCHGGQVPFLNLFHDLINKSSHCMVTQAVSLGDKTWVLRSEAGDGHGRPGCVCLLFLDIQLGCLCPCPGTPVAGSSFCPQWGQAVSQIISKGTRHWAGQSSFPLCVRILSRGQGALLINRLLWDPLKFASKMNIWKGMG